MFTNFLLLSSLELTIFFFQGYLQPPERGQRGFLHPDAAAPGEHGAGLLEVAAEPHRGHDDGRRVPGRGRSAQRGQHFFSG